MGSAPDRLHRRVAIRTFLGGDLAGATRTLLIEAREIVLERLCTRSSPLPGHQSR